MIFLTEERGRTLCLSQEWRKILARSRVSLVKRF